VGLDRRRDARDRAGIGIGRSGPLRQMRGSVLSPGLLEPAAAPSARLEREGNLRGVLAPVLDHYAVAFVPVHGFTSATLVHDVAEDDDGRPLIVLYVGDFDPSGMYMSDGDLPARFAKYGGDHITLRRIALRPEQLAGLPSFPAHDKRGDPRYKWFVANRGDLCWELDAMDPNDLRDCVQRQIVGLIEPVAWRRCEDVNKAEQETLRTILDKWGAS
jgi:hypothetical protein